MKKGIASISLFVYILVSCGVIINFHYCMNRLDSLQFFASETEICGRCGMHIENADGCCRDEVKIIKMDEDQRTTDIASYDILPLTAPIQLTSEFLVASFFTEKEGRHFWNHSPPLLDRQDTYLQNRVFRI